MKNIFFFLATALCFSVQLFAQAPQGVNYQAVAYNAGMPVANQPIGVRLSVLDGSASGTVVYQETQNPTTDNTGLFSIVIGNGSVVSGAFNSVAWGIGSKWLKTEIDISGGSSYVIMGTSQFMSVPYALYANNAASSATFEHPDGLNNITPVILNDTASFTVPAGKNLYVNYDYATVDTIGFSNLLQTNAMTCRPFIGASSGSEVRSGATGFLVDATVVWKSININCDPFTVPAGKIFIVTNQHVTGSVNAVLNGRILRRNIVGLVLKAGDALATNLSCLAGNVYNINGYLRSINFFSVAKPPGIFYGLITV